MRKDTIRVVVSNQSTFKMHLQNSKRLCHSLFGNVAKGKLATGFKFQDVAMHVIFMFSPYLETILEQRMNINIL